ncbi:MAG: hypothetical protein AB1847_22555 [bacterium]
MEALKERIKITPLQVLALVSTLGNELVEVSSDGVITVREMVNMGMKIARQLGIEVDTRGVDLTKIL